MKKIVFFAILTCAFFGMNAQSLGIMNARSPQEYLQNNTPKVGVVDTSRKLIQYPYTYEDRDIVWASVVWEVIDLNQKLNHPLYFPENDNMADRKALFTILVESIKNGTIKEVYDDDYFVNKLTYGDVISRLEVKAVDQYALDKLAEGQQLTSADTITYTVTPSMVEQYRVKGIWFFDKRYGEMKYRILGIAPYGRDASGVKAGDSDLVPLFWVWYTDAREILNSYRAFVSKNAVNFVSFDDIFNQRRFDAMIYKESNIYADRQIEDYIRGNAMFQLRESQKLKESIRDFEQDMWVF